MHLSSEGFAGRLLRVRGSVEDSGSGAVREEVCALRKPYALCRAVLPRQRRWDSFLFRLRQGERPRGRRAFGAVLSLGVRAVCRRQLVSCSGTPELTLRGHTPKKLIPLKLRLYGLCSNNVALMRIAMSNHIPIESSAVSLAQNY